MGGVGSGLRKGQMPFAHRAMWIRRAIAEHPIESGSFKIALRYMELTGCGRQQFWRDIKNLVEEGRLNERLLGRRGATPVYEYYCKVDFS